MSNEWQNTALIAYCRKNIASITNSKSFSHSLPPMWSVELTRNGALEDSFDSDEGLFCALPSSSTDNASCFDGEERDLVRRLINDIDFFKSDRGQRVFFQTMLKKRLLDTTNATQQSSVRDTIFIGKSESAMIQLENPSVSRIHAAIFLGVQEEVKMNYETNKEEKVPVCRCFVVDLGSSNGTCILLPKTHATSQQQYSPRLVPHKPVALEDGATIRCATSSVNITVHCASWIDRLMQQQEQRQLMQHQQQQTTRIRQRNEENEEGGGIATTRNDAYKNSINNNNNNNNNKNDDVFEEVASSLNMTAAARIQSLRNLPFRALKQRKQQIELEILTRRSSESEGAGAIESLKKDLRDIDFVLSEKESEELNRSNMGGGGTSSSTMVIEEVVEEK